MPTALAKRVGDPASSPAAPRALGSIQRNGLSAPARRARPGRQRRAGQVAAAAAGVAASRSLLVGAAARPLEADPAEGQAQGRRWGTAWRQLQAPRSPALQPLEEFADDAEACAPAPAPAAADAALPAAPAPAAEPAAAATPVEEVPLSFALARCAAQRPDAPRRVYVLLSSDLRLRWMVHVSSLHDAPRRPAAARQPAAAAPGPAAPAAAAAQPRLQPRPQRRRQRPAAPLPVPSAVMFGSPHQAWGAPSQQPDFEPAASFSATAAAAAAVLPQQPPALADADAALLAAFAVLWLMLSGGALP
ncbi:hypothetical protein Rsub_08734 [Raphidocelis subcapitata]|uniref:Uncharacterized protein n=1 Tax=Raphidocelis subcapitata TaxID=307507 RepID=A0A2V0P9D9_9CHLO|nr:hypothetical protein Rsub_08734 [Raphidocelis subcapitata]|eukprot:GBF96189.1 hypothetical protein Rsub_08734 [Raphidocelis subcapitata]